MSDYKRGYRTECNLIVDPVDKCNLNNVEIGHAVIYLKDAIKNVKNISIKIPNDKGQFTYWHISGSRIN